VISGERDLGKIGMAAATGAISGGIGALTFGTGAIAARVGSELAGKVVTSVLWNSVGSGAAEAATQAYEGKGYNIGKIGVASFWGGMSAFKSSPLDYSASKKWISDRAMYAVEYGIIQPVDTLMSFTSDKVFEKLDERNGATSSPPEVRLSSGLVATSTREMVSDARSYLGLQHANRYLWMEARQAFTGNWFY